MMKTTCLRMNELMAALCIFVMGMYINTVSAVDPYSVMQVDDKIHVGMNADTAGEVYINGSNSRYSTALFKFGGCGSKYNNYNYDYTISNQEDWGFTFSSDIEAVGMAQFLNFRDGGNHDMALHVKGPLVLWEKKDTEPRDSTYCSLYVKQNPLENNDLYIYATEDTATATRITSHKDIRDVSPDAITSFADANVTMPYSITHFNSLLGKGSVIDFTKMVYYIQKKMQDELGEDAGRLVFDYDLPEEDRITYDAWESAHFENKINDRLRMMANGPWIKVEHGVDGSIPAIAVEEVDEYQTVSRFIDVAEDVLDLNEMKIKKEYRTKQISEKVATGNKIKRLKDNYKFERGNLYRCPTIDDMDLMDIANSMPELPSWIIIRMQEGVAQGQAMSRIIEEIHVSLEAKSRNIDRHKDMAFIFE